MPFTLAHAAAALPFRRLRLIPSALVIGTLAPDFEYFLRLTPVDRFGHTLAGALVMTLPLALIVLWIFHRFVKLSVVQLLPDRVHSRLSADLEEFRFAGWARFSRIIVSLLLGIATHLLWDSFTHPTTWLYHHWWVLRQPVHLPIVGWMSYYKIFQHGSTIIGIAALSVWFARWYLNTRPSIDSVGKSLPPERKTMILAIMASISCLGAILRVGAGGANPTEPVAFSKLVGEAVVTAIAVAWWQLVAYGIYSSTSSFPVSDALTGRRR